MIAIRLVALPFALLLPLFLEGCAEDASDGDGSSKVPEAGVLDGGQEGGQDGGLAFPAGFLEQQVEWKPCVLDDAKNQGTAECADVSVPLFWERPAEGSISLHLKRHGGGGAARRQLWMLDGGPGGAGTTSYGRYLELLAEQDPELEVLTLDHRGTGLSNRLGCPEQEKGTSPWGIFLSDAEWTTCLADLASQKVPLEAYTVTQAAWDTAFLVELLQRPEVPRFVWGSSYGTYLAHRYAQVFPSQATGIILDSICPSESCHLDQQDELANEVVHDILDLCGKDAFCSSKLGSDPWQFANDVLGKMRTGHCPGFTSLGLGAREIQQMPFILAQRWGLRPLVPAIYYRMNRCDAGDVSFLKKVVMSYMVSDTSENAPIFYRRFSHVISRNITFSELMSESLPTQEQADEKDSLLLATSHNSAKLLGAYASWPRYQRDAFHHGWASRDVPFLMLNGTLDLQTPMAMADEARVKLAGPGRTFVEIPWGAHGAIGQTPVTDQEKMPCGMQILLSHVRAPEQAPDTSCLQELLAVDFHGYADRFGVETALGTSDLWENAATPTPFNPPSGPYVILPAQVPMPGSL